METAELQSDLVTCEIEIDAPAAKVFEALTDPAQLESWWGGEGVYQTYNWKIDVRPGGAWSCDARSAGGEMTVHGKYIEVQPPTLLVYTWNPSWEPNLPETTIRLELIEESGKTRLRVEHSGFAAHQESRLGHEAGWSRVLAWLSEYFR